MRMKLKKRYQAQLPRKIEREKSAVYNHILRVARKIPGGMDEGVAQI